MGNLIEQDIRWKYFKCIKCGLCCEETPLPYDPKRIHDIANYLNFSVDELIEKYYGKISDNRRYIHFYEDDSRRMPCPFLKKKNGKAVCSIYFVRPKGCELFPYGTDFGLAGLDCPAHQKVMECLNTQNT